MAASRKVASLGLLLPYLKPYRGRVALAAVALVAASGLVLGLGQGCGIWSTRASAAAAPRRSTAPRWRCSAWSRRWPRPPAAASS
ncbi:hypothetical protein ACFQY5_19570 [Paeniroseomonas aquatica]|uniref:hypothetical protein n=1 Tax=Paeniroseomonas aquatica TaxID=373043 RepID=UPI003616B9D9